MSWLSVAWDWYAAHSDKVNPIVAGLGGVACLGRRATGPHRYQSALRADTCRPATAADREPPVLSPEEARQLIDCIPTDTLVGLRDRALIGVLIYSFARVSAAVAMRVEDYFPQGKRWWLSLHEKGGKQHEMPVHHTLEEHLDSYIRGGESDVLIDVLKDYIYSVR